MQCSAGVPPDVPRATCPRVPRQENPRSRRSDIRTYNLCFLGFGNVNRTLVRLLQDREQELRKRYGISWCITGVASRRLGWIADSAGLGPAAVLSMNADSPSGLSRAGAPAPQPTN